MFLLDRLLLILFASAVCVLIWLLFRKGCKKHERLFIFVMIFIVQGIMIFGPDVLFAGAIPSKVTLSYRNIQNVWTFNHKDNIYAIREYVVYDEDGSVSHVKGRITVYTPWIVGYYESDVPLEIPYLYDDQEGESGLVFFQWNQEEDGTTVFVMTSYLNDPITSLVIEGRTIPFVTIEGSNFATFVMEKNVVFNRFTDSILVNGIEIGKLYEE